ncbi:MAG: TraB/GumN family protein [Halobacteria archaeon]|nr:TraB/GumN family protein [Halobacteria archaeon]
MENTGKVVVVGTAHISEDSAREVKETITRERPDVVAIELDERRYESIKRLREEYDVKYGTDMVTAIEEAERRGIPIALIDRDIRITLRRLWSKMTTWEKVRLVGSLFAGVMGLGGIRRIDIDDIMEDEVVQAYIDEFRGISPNAAQVIIDERDAHMAAKLHNLRREGKKVVAVVGIGHKDGIERFLGDPESIPETWKDAPEEIVDTTPKRHLSSDVAESDDEVVVLVELPGCEKKDIDVKFQGGGLRIEAKRDKKVDDPFRYIREDRPVSFAGTVDIPYDVVPEDATAGYENGILKVRLPKKDGKSIEIE